MFIKHIRSKKWDKPGEFVFEVKSYSICSMGDDKLLVMAEDGQGTAFEVHKDGDELYIMNDNGRTIDSYVWPKPVKEAVEDFEEHIETTLRARGVTV